MLTSFLPYTKVFINEILLYTHFKDKKRRKLLIQK